MLEDVFFVISGRKLKLHHDISVIDLLPYTTKDNWEDMTNEEKASAFKAAQWAISAKEPDVVLCAGQIFFPEKLSKHLDERWKLESKDVDAVFREKKKKNPTRHGREQRRQPDQGPSREWLQS